MADGIVYSLIRWTASNIADNEFLIPEVVQIFLNRKECIWHAIKNNLQIYCNIVRQYATHNVNMDYMDINFELNRLWTQTDVVEFLNHAYNAIDFLNSEDVAYAFIEVLTEKIFADRERLKELKVFEYWQVQAVDLYCEGESAESDIKRILQEHLLLRDYLD